MHVHGDLNSHNISILLVRKQSIGKLRDNEMDPYLESINFSLKGDDKMRNQV